MKGRLLAALALVLAGCAAPEAPTLAADAALGAPICVAPCRVMVDDGPERAWEPHLAVDPNDPLHIVVATSEMSDGFLDTGFSFGRARVSVSFDGGATWETRPLPGGPEAGPTHPLAGYARVGGDPVLAFLPDGTLVMSALAANMVAVPGVPALVWPGSAIYTTRSTDGGVTWGDERILDRGDGLLVSASVGVGMAALWKINDKEWLTVGPDGTLLLVWSQFSYLHPDEGLSLDAGGRLVFSSSNDGGLTWSPLAALDDDGAPFGASPVIGRDGVWRVAYVDLDSEELRFAESRDRGATWDKRVIGASSWMPVMRAQTLESGAERLLLAYTTGGDERDGQHRTELAWSDDGGATWSAPLVLDLPEGEGAPMPDVAGAPGDAAWVTFFDVEGGYGGQRTRYLALRVVDGVAGETVVLDEMETEARQLGHYMGLATLPDGDAMAAWVAYEDGAYDVVAARIAPPP